MGLVVLLYYLLSVGILRIYSAIYSARWHFILLPNTDRSAIALLLRIRKQMEYMVGAISNSGSGKLSVTQPSLLFSMPHPRASI